MSGSKHINGRTTDGKCKDKQFLTDSSNNLLSNESADDTEDYADDTDDSAFPKQQETSIFLAIQAAVSQEDELYTYLSHVLSLFRSSSTCLVLKTLLNVVAIVIFIIGVIRFRECPYEQELPLFLVLEGLAIIIKTSLNAINTCLRRTKEENERNTVDTCSDILSLFLVLWTLTGTVWTFGIYSHVSVDDEPDDCSKLVYTCSLLFLSVTYCSFVSFLIILAILSTYYKYNRRNSNKLHTPYEIRVDR